MRLYKAQMKVNSDLCCFKRTRCLSISTPLTSSISTSTLACAESPKSAADYNDPGLCQSCLLFVRMRFLVISHFGVPTGSHNFDFSLLSPARFGKLQLSAS